MANSELPERPDTARTMAHSGGFSHPPIPPFVDPIGPPPPRAEHIGNNGVVSIGKRAGSRRGSRPSPRLRAKPVAYAGGFTVAVIAWGYLVWMAIDFGESARTGQSAAWALLGVAAVGAMACLFAALMLLARLLRELGVTSPVADHDSDETPPPPGGRRRA